MTALAPEILTLVPGIIHFAMWCHKRLSARRAARKAGHPIALDPASVQTGLEDARDIGEQAVDIFKKAKR